MKYWIPVDYIQYYIALFYLFWHSICPAKLHIVFWNIQFPSPIFNNSIAIRILIIKTQYYVHSSVLMADQPTARVTGNPNISTISSGVCGSFPSTSRWLA